MSFLTNRQVADFLGELAVLMELNGENPFRIRACANAARTIEGLDREVEELVAQNALTSIKGIGRGLADLIAEFAAKGTTDEYENLKRSIPPGLFDMLRIKGLGPKKILTIRKELDIDSLEKLETACRDGSLGRLSGFGSKTQENILKGIEQLRQYQGLHLIDDALAAARPLHQLLEGHPQAIRTSLAGGLRRCMETIGGIDLVVGTDHPAEIAASFVAHPSVEEVITREENKTILLLDSGIQAELRAVADDRFPFVLHHLTGSEEHRAQMRARAHQRGLKLDEHGLFRSEERLPCADEEAIFAALDLSYIPPELREGLGEIEAAARGDLPALITQADIRGMLHVHTTYSDGDSSIEEMALAVHKRGYQYLGIADHSRSAPYAGGLQPDDVRRQQEEIDTLNEKFTDFRIFKGIESDILADGSLDYDDDLLDSFDFVVVSIHSRFQMNAEKMTRRLVRAVEHPATTILGHLTGRLLLEREGYAVDVDAVVEAAVRNEVAIEINTHPSRLDMDWRHLKKARERGAKIAVNTDAHRIAGLDHLPYGIGVARKGWLRPKDVINTFDTQTITAYFQQR